MHAIKYLHRNYRRTHPFKPNQPETCFLRLPHQFIFTLVLAGSFSAAVSLLTPAPFSLAEHSNPATAVHPPSPLCARSGSNIPWVRLTEEIPSERRPFCTTSEEGQITGKSQETPTCFSRTSVMLLFTCYPNLYGICRMLLEKLHRLNQGPHRMIHFLFLQLKELRLCSGLRLLIGVVWLLVLFWS